MQNKTEVIGQLRTINDKLQELKHASNKSRSANWSVSVTDYSKKESLFT